MAADSLFTSYFPPCQQSPALRAMSSVASHFQRCQQFPALPAISSVASNFQRCQQFPALPAISSVASNFHHFQTLAHRTGFQTRPAIETTTYWMLYGTPKPLPTGCQGIAPHREAPAACSFNTQDCRTSGGTGLAAIATTNRTNRGCETSMAFAAS